MSKEKGALGLGAGRPSVNRQKVSMEDKPTLVRINAQVTEAEHQKLKIHAAKANKSISDILRAFIGTLPD